MVRDKEISEYNIAQARTSFIISPTKPSYRDLAKSYGVSKSALQSISVQEDWEAQRIEYQNQVITKAQNSFKAKVAKERAKKLKKINTIFEKGADKLIEQLDSKQYRITVRDLNTLARLSEFLAGEVESRKGHTFKLDKPLSEYTVEELLAMQNRIIEGTAEVVEIEDKEFSEDVDDDDEIKQLEYLEDGE